MQINMKNTIKTHEGAPAKQINPYLQLRRTVMSCLLWEKEFYESGQDIATRIKTLVPMIDPILVSKLAKEARNVMNLRHVPLLLVREMARTVSHRRYVSRALQSIIQRPDEITEFLAIYWADGKCPIAKKVKQGLARCFNKFSEYQFAKYDRDNAIKLRDVMFLVHPTPYGLGGISEKYDKVARKNGRKEDNLFSTEERLFEAITNRTLKTPDTWEVALSSGADKKETFIRLMAENKLGALAFLRNLRNMIEAQIPRALIDSYAETLNVSKVLPFRFIAAAKYAPSIEDIIEKMLLRATVNSPRLEGKTTILVDVSGSMDAALSSKSQMTRLDAACGLAMIAREMCHEVRLLAFSDVLKDLPPRRGFALRDAIVSSLPHGGTRLGAAIQYINKEDTHERIIVITDEQSADQVPDPIAKKSYMINIASARNGVGYYKWIHIDGFSEATLRFIVELENSNTQKMVLKGDEDEN